MKPVLLGLAVMSLTATQSWGRDTGDTDFDSIAQQGIEHLYDLQFTTADSLFRKLTTLRPGHPAGHFFLAIDIDCFTDLASFKKTTGDILRALRASAKAPGKDRIYTCGEKEYDAWQERKDKGVPVDRGTQKDLVAMRDELKLAYRFPFEDEAQVID